MILSDCLSIKFSQVLESDEWSNEQDSHNGADNIITAQHEWNGAIAAIQKLLHQTIELEDADSHLKQGMIISSLTPLLNDVKLVSRLETVVFSPQPNPQSALMPCEERLRQQTNTSSLIHCPLNIDDQLLAEQFCLVLTDKLNCIVVKTKEKFLFSFNPDVVTKIWYLLRVRLFMSHHPCHDYMQQLVDQFAHQQVSYQIVSQFTRYLLAGIKEQKLVDHKSLVEKEKQSRNQGISLQKTPLPAYPELELLQALTHEIRTPLTTIKTITKMLLKKAKLAPNLNKHLEVIEQECTEQINRMELIFQAVELETKPSKKDHVQLVDTSLEHILNQAIPKWKKQAQRRNIVLDIVIPHKLPQIVSDPAILSQMLSGLMEKFTRNLPSGGNFKVLILPAGNQLKLQFLSETKFNANKSKCLGKVLLFQPDTGNLSLSHDVTKNIFHALGGKLTVKQKANQGEVLTIFLPLEHQTRIETKKNSYSVHKNKGGRRGQRLEVRGQSTGNEK